MGYSDAQIAWVMRINEHEVTRQRYKLGIRRTYKMVDTCAAEFEAKTPYFYSTFDGENESIPSERKRLLCWAQVRTASDRELNSIIAACMVY